MVEEDRAPEHRLLAEHQAAPATPAGAIGAEHLPVGPVALDPGGVASGLGRRPFRVDRAQKGEVDRPDARPDRGSLVVGQKVADEPDLGGRLRPGDVAERVRVAEALAGQGREGFCDPHPLRYITRPKPTSEVWLVRHFLPDYQGSSVWTSIGAIYLALLRTVDPERAAAETARYAAWIERDGTYWEVLGADGGCWRGRGGLMLGEESMLWGAIFLDHLRSPVAPAARLA